MGNKKRIFFENLDGLRFFSFLVVFLFHANKTIFSNVSTGSFYAVTTRLFHNGGLGVNFFFVLSGFLISYLLIEEKKLRGTIQIGNFYVRRILRIWPLFYACVLIGFFIFPYLKQMMGQSPQESARIGYYLLLVNNFDFMRTWPSVPDALILSVLWSVAVEEQFYLSWPVLMKYCSIKRMPLLMLAIIVLSLVFRSFYLEHTDGDYAVRYFHTLSVIGDMALGGLLAYYSAQSEKFLNKVRQMSPVFIAVLYVLAIAFFLYKSEIFGSNKLLLLSERMIIGLVFGCIILEQNYAERSFFKMKNLTRISKLGNYTYGLYCLHFGAIVIVNAVFQKLPIDRTNVVISLTEFATALLLSIGVSWLSYHLYEHRFLKLKDKFAFITKG
ncbi:MAG TPA: acyltransferase [Phnomibacter sp.]|nr:acyltransferase [Phnomibacter sp.]